MMVIFLVIGGLLILYGLYNFVLSIYYFRKAAQAGKKEMQEFKEYQQYKKEIEEEINSPFR
jgi:hypothetical protein